MAGKKVSDVLRKLAEIIDSGGATQARIELNDIEPTQIKVTRITDPVFSGDELRRYNFSLEITMSNASLRKAMK